MMKYTMLIVDDNEMNRDILKLLFHSNYEIMEAEDGTEALEILEGCRGNVDIVLLDLFMDGLGGLEVLDLRKSLDYFKNVPVVIITGSEHLEDQVKAFELGVSDYINKPFIPEIVLSRVNNVMASRRRMLDIEIEAEKLKLKSEVDQMTGLLNKITVEYRIEDVLNQQIDKLHALLVIDIDNFKSVNDLSGHQAGDHVIRIVADLISSHFRKTDIIGRIGGDEYVVCMVDVISMDVVREKANELIQLMKYKPNLTIPENVSLSIGIASTAGINIDYDDLFKKADQALYEAKENGKARYQEYGVKPVRLEDDNRPAAILLSRNRSICSIVNAMMPQEIRVIEALKTIDMQFISDEEREKCVLAYVDVSDEKGNAENFWEVFQEGDYISMDKVVAICREGDLAQYKAAMQAGVWDILSAPIDGAAFKRRTNVYLERNKQES